MHRSWLDLLIGANQAMSAMLMVSTYIGWPAAFRVFPNTLLVVTLLRLSLNISRSFSSWFIAILEHAPRDRSSRWPRTVIHPLRRAHCRDEGPFPLQARSRKQTTDADLTGGLIDQVEAQTRRKQIATEAGF